MPARSRKARRINSSKELLSWIKLAHQAGEDGNGEFELATITSIQTGGVRVAFDADVDDSGNPVETAKTFPQLGAAITQQVGSRVLMLKLGKTWVVVSNISDDVPWTGLPYATNWADQGSPYEPGMYCKVDGIVYIRGLIKTTVSFANQAAFTTALPVGCRTANASGYVYGSGVNSSGAANGNGHRLRAHSDGTLWVEYTTPTTAGGNFVVAGCFVADA